MATKQKSGLYRTKVKIGVGPDGKDIVKWVSGKTKKELEDAKREATAYYIDGTGLEEDKLFGQYAVEWYNVRKAPFSQPSTQNCYRSILNKHLIPTFGARNLRAIKPIELQKYVNEFAGQSKTQINMIISTLKGIFGSALQDRIIPSNPAAGIRKPEHKDAIEKRALTDDEKSRIEALFETHEYGLYIAAMYYTGMRPGEVRGLKWGDINWATGMIHVQRDVDFAAGGTTGDLKTKAADRYIPIADELKRLMLLYVSTPDAFIIPGVNGKPLSASAANRIWLTLMRDCDMVLPIALDKNGERTEKQYYSANDIRGQYRPLITPHAMRHNFITMCWEKGLDIMLTMKLVGHSDYQTTRNIYTHLSEKHLEKARDEVNRIFASE